MLMLCAAQESTIHVDFSSLDWKTLGSVEVTEFESNKVTSVSHGVGIGYLDGLEFKNGVIECDLYSPDERAYLGLVFRIGELNNFECIYFQPHTSGKWDAVQYDPIFNGSASWQLYNGKLYQAVAHIPVKKWFHVKIEVFGDLAKVYLDNKQDHTLSIKLKHKTRSGSVGVYSYHPAIFKNLKIKKYSPLMVPQKQSVQSTENELYLSNWQISNPYSCNYTKDINSVKENINKWYSVEAEENYLINLNRHFTKTNTKNSVLAKVLIKSIKAQGKKIHIGYSDKIRLCLNSKLLFEGDNSYKASGLYEDRGYVLDKHQTIDLVLEEGENELLIEISEDKFGWGFIVQLSDLEGIEIIR